MGKVGKPCPVEATPPSLHQTLSHPWSPGWGIEKAGAKQEHQAGQPSPTSLQRAGLAPGAGVPLNPPAQVPARCRAPSPSWAQKLYRSAREEEACPPGGDGADGLPVDGDELVQDHDGSGEDAI